jgi:hypothetical protein
MSCFQEFFFSCTRTIGTQPRCHLPQSPFNTFKIQPQSIHVIPAFYKRPDTTVLKVLEEPFPVKEFLVPSGVQTASAIESLLYLG